MTRVEGLERLTVDLDLVVKVGVVEDLHGDLLLAKVLCLELGVLDGDVLLDVTAGELDLLVLAGAVHAHDCPVGNGDGDAHDEDKEEVSLEAATTEDGEGPLDDPGDAEDEGGEVEVGEVAIALSEADERRVFDGGGGRDGDGVGRHGCATRPSVHFWRTC